MIIRLLLRRATAYGFVAMALTVVAFGIARFSGDPVEALLDRHASAADYRELRSALGLERPLIEQFAGFVMGLANGDFGTSWQQRRPVAELIGERLPASVELALIAAVLSLAAGIAIGVFAGMGRRGWPARLLMRFSLAGVAVPSFLVAVLLVWLFSVELRILPAFGRGETLSLGWWSTGLLTASGLRSLVLPVITLALFQTAWIARLVASEMHAALQSAHVIAAHARGLPRWRIYFGHALPVALLPVITLSGLQAGHGIAIAMITESVFQWPGLGALFVQSVASVDAPVIAACLLLAGVLIVTLQAIVDLATIAADPRLRDGLLRPPS
ncbi:MAG: ABC transporter permease [Alphaproteobacteria bacterium]|nr:ABC transporter permease [Alphaproteobacteria bacterium]